MSNVNDPSPSLRIRTDDTKSVSPESVIKPKEKAGEAPQSSKKFEEVLEKGTDKKKLAKKEKAARGGAETAASIFELSGQKPKVGKGARLLQAGISPSHGVVPEQGVVVKHGEEATDEDTDELGNIPIGENQPKARTDIVAPLPLPLEDIPGLAKIAMRETVEKKESKVEELPRNAFMQDVGDLTRVNPLAGTPPPVVTPHALPTPKVAETKAPLPIKEVVDQIVDRIYTLKTGGQTDTTIVLKHGGLFDGVTVKISSYQSARGEFNITFSNLTQQAKGILDVNEDALRQSFATKGLTVHIFATSPVPEPIIRTDSGEMSREGRREEGGGEEGRSDQGGRER